MILISDFLFDRTELGHARLTADLVVDLEKGYRGSHEFSCLKSGSFATLVDDVLTVKRGYVWNECSPAFYFKGKRIGTPCSEAESFASAIHDATRSIYRLPCVPFDRKDTDDFFYDALELRGSKVKHTYHFAVKSFIGTVFIWITGSGKLTCRCIKCDR